MGQIGAEALDLSVGLWVALTLGAVASLIRSADTLFLWFAALAIAFFLVTIGVRINSTRRLFLASIWRRRAAAYRDRAHELQLRGGLPPWTELPYSSWR